MIKIKKNNQNLDSIQFDFDSLPLFLENIYTTLSDKENKILHSILLLHIYVQGQIRKIHVLSKGK